MTRNIESTRNRGFRRTLGSAVLAIAAVAVIGLTGVTPARADYDGWRAHNEWREHREWQELREHRGLREDHLRTGFYFNFGTPQPRIYYEPGTYYEYDRY